jgi:hypothetical protein
VFQSARRGYVRLAKTSGPLVVVLALFLSRQTVRSESVLISHWKLDEGSGTTTADAVASRSGTLRNGATWIAGRSGFAVNMDGVDDYIELSAVEVTGPAITLAAWLKNSSFPNGVDQRFIAKAVEQRTYWMLSQTNDGQNRLRFTLRAGGETTTLTASTGTLPLNTWYHAAATYDGSRMLLYLNGTEVGSIAKSGSVSRGRTASVNIGRSPDGSNYLSGAIDDVRIYSSALTQEEIAALLSGSTPSNQPPSVSLTSPASGAVFTAPATVPLTATASDADGSIARVDFYSGTTLIDSDTSSPYSVSWTNVPAGAYALTAVARDNGGATTVSSTRDITVSSPNLPDTAVFVPSINHLTAVDRYLLEIFPAGADPTVANPVASRDLGKPAITNGECRVDITSTMQALPPGTYIATVTAIGSGGSTQSAPSPQFTR